MPVESFAEASSAAWWSYDPKRMFESLPSAEALLALVALAVVVYLWWALRARQAQNGANESYELVPVTSQGPLRVGAKTRLSIVGEGQAPSVMATIDEMGRRYLTISVPLAEAQRYHPGMSIALMAPAGAAAYQFTATIQQRRKRGDTLLIDIERPAWVERVQRRANFRVPIHLPTSVARIDAESPANTAFRAIMCDLSAGGTTIVVPFKPQRGSLLRLRIPLPSLANASYEVRVLRSAPTRGAQSAMWAAGCEFLLMDEVVQERIMQACFELERAAKAKAQ